MNVIAFFAASALSGGNPISQESWIRDVDYPREAQQLQQQGPAAYTLLVSPEGQVIECKITRSSGYRRLDSRACALLMSRAKFDPARDVDGSPAYMLYRDTISFALIGSKRQTLIYGSDIDVDRKSTRLNSSHRLTSRMPSSA
jgi:TonB family protein